MAPFIFALIVVLIIFVVLGILILAVSKFIGRLPSALVAVILSVGLAVQPALYNLECTVEGQWSSDCDSPGDGILIMFGYPMFFFGALVMFVVAVVLVKSPKKGVKKSK